MRAVFYARCSDRRQDKSVAEQTRWSQTVPGVTIVESFADDGIPGDIIAERPGLQNMLRFCEDQCAQGQPIDVILLWHTDRLSRASSRKTAAIYVRLEEAGVCRAITPEGVKVFDDDITMLLMNVEQDLGNSAYVKKLSRDITRGVNECVIEGRWTGGRIPFGYAIADGRLVLGDKTNVAIVRWMFNHYLNRDSSLRLIAEELNRRKVLAPRGGEWKWRNVASILRNVTYTGTREWGRHARGKYHTVGPDGITAVKRGVPLPPRVPVPPHPAIIDADTFGAVQRKLASKVRCRTRGEGAKTFKWLMTGLLYCGDCQSMMTGHHLHNEGKRAYLCSKYTTSGCQECHRNRVFEDDLLARIDTGLRSHFSQPNIVAASEALIRTDAVDSAANREQTRDDLTRRVRELTRDRDTAARRMMTVTDDTVAALAQEQVQRIAAELANVQGKLTDFMREHMATTRTVEERQADLNTATHFLKTLNRYRSDEQKRVYVRRIIAKIVVHFTHHDTAKTTRTKCKGLLVHGTAASGMGDIGMDWIDW